VAAVASEVAGVAGGFGSRRRR